MTSGFQVDPSDAAGLRHALDALADQAQRALDAGATDAAALIASRARGRGSAQGAPTSRVAAAISSQGATVGYNSGTVATSSGATVGDLMYAAEYGARTPQTMRHWPGHTWRGSGSGAGYLLWPTIAESSDAILDTWVAQYDEVIKRVW